MKMKIKKLISAVLLCTVLVGCSNSNALPDTSSESSEPSNCPISTMRTGTERQGIKTYGNSFECTETGLYFMCNVGEEAWLLYADHDSDTVIKLCGRPDCDHTGSDCNAYFDNAIGVCYYNGFLYTYDSKSMQSGGDLIRMNLDGTERVTVYNTSSFAQANGYKSVGQPKIFNGVLFLAFNKIDENGETISDGGYYKLDGSMNEPKIDTFWELTMKADGESFIGVVDSDKESKLLVYGIWEPEKGAVAELFRSENMHTRGYIGTKAEYYIEDGIIIENNYDEGKKELVDTGLKGNYQLVCFPDCMVAYEYLSDEELQQGVTLNEATFHFYDWNYNDLGSVKTNYPFDETILATGLICGETPDRIFLTDNFYYIPRYYINKSDFGTGNIEIHPLTMPDFGE